MTSKFTTISKNSQQGSVLLEALIAFLIFGMGLLGVIGLQATAINNTLDARYRSDAAFLANQIIAQIWADPAISIDPATLMPRYDIQTSYACNPCKTNNGNVNTQSWVTQIQAGFLPGVTDALNQPIIAISNNSAGIPTVVTVTVNWQAPQGQQQAHSYVTRTEIQFNQPQP